MKLFFLFLAFLLSFRLYALIEVGDLVPNSCYPDVSGKQFCLDDAKDTLRVIVRNAGWCPGCQAEMEELAPRSEEFKDQPVTFISLSGQGTELGSPPDTQFLKSWQSRYKIPFIVAGSPNDFGKGTYFSGSVYIPNVVILDKQRKLAFKHNSDQAFSVDQLFEVIKHLLN